jgi:hypothetical protein
MSDEQEASYEQRPKQKPCGFFGYAPDDGQKESACHVERVRHQPDPLDVFMEAMNGA